MIQTDIEIINKLGLHARATAKLIALTTSFKCSIKISKGTRTVDGKNMMGVLMLGAGKGTILQCVFEGDDEALAHQSVLELFNRRFDEGQ